MARSVAVLVAIGGLCVTALLLGIVSEQISQMIEDLKKGRSEVGRIWIGRMRIADCRRQAAIGRHGWPLALHAG